ncbi:MAG: GNAT family N-acetyltransferase [Planctomycetota bacterium]
MSSSPEFEPFAARAPSVADRPAIVELAAAAGAHGVYVANDLARDPSGRALASRGLAMFGRDGVLAFAWFGARGNLIVLGAEGGHADPTQVARAIDAVALEWRIALGPEPVLAALARAAPVPPVLLRRQLYYVADPELVRAHEPDPRVRVANVVDLDALVQASIELNRVDLELDPAQVSKRWVRQAASERVRAGTAFVVGPPGAPFAKLDIGSQGRAGVVIEGVFTLEAHRSQGWGSRLVHGVCRRHLAAGRPTVCLHVAESNAAGRRCYEKAGMRPGIGVGLLLRA